MVFLQEALGESRGQIQTGRIAAIGSRGLRGQNADDLDLMSARKGSAVAESIIIRVLDRHAPDDLGVFARRGENGVVGIVIIGMTDQIGDVDRGLLLPKTRAEARIFGILVNRVGEFVLGIETQEGEDEFGDLVAVIEDDHRLIRAFGITAFHHFVLGKDVFFGVQGLADRIGIVVHQRGISREFAIARTSENGFAEARDRRDGIPIAWEGIVKRDPRIIGIATHRGIEVVLDVNPIFLAHRGVIIAGHVVDEFLIILGQMIRREGRVQSIRGADEGFHGEFDVDFAVSPALGDDGGAPRGGGAVHQTAEIKRSLRHFDGVARKHVILDGSDIAADPKVH